jgi:hypothetical protein
MTAWLCPLLIVRLTSEQELRAADVGYRRQRNAVERGFPPRHRGGSLWGGHIEGACAELAASIAYALPWTGEEVWTVPPTDRVPDLGDRTEVRWVAPSRYEPTLNFDAERDLDDRYYDLVSGLAPEFTIHGHILGATARTAGLKVDYPERTVYRVPASALSPIRVAA